MKISVCGKGGSGKSALVALLAKGIKVIGVVPLLDNDALLFIRELNRVADKIMELTRPESCRPGVYDKKFM